MTEDSLRERIAELEKLRVGYLADLNAVGGAIQDCEFWLNRLRNPPVPEVQEPRLVRDEAPPE
jgi:hypothetical protein